MLNFCQYHMSLQNVCVTVKLFEIIVVMSMNSVYKLQRLGTLIGGTAHCVYLKCII